MSANEPFAEAQRWLRFAGEDLAAARLLAAQSEAAPRHACHLAQQAAEKAIKAALISLQIDFPRLHNLDALRNLLPDGWSIRIEQPDLANLTAWAVAARYPGDWPEPTASDASEAVETARTVIDAIRRDLENEHTVEEHSE